MYSHYRNKLRQSVNWMCMFCRRQKSHSSSLQPKAARVIPQRKRQTRGKRSNYGCGDDTLSADRLSTIHRFTVHLSQKMLRWCARVFIPWLKCPCQISKKHAWGFWKSIRAFLFKEKVNLACPSSSLSRWQQTEGCTLQKFSWAQNFSKSLLYNFIVS